MHFSQFFNFLFILYTLLGTTNAAPQRNNNNGAGNNNGQNQNGNNAGNTNAGNTGAGNNNAGNNNGGNGGAAATTLDAANIQDASASNGNPDQGAGESPSTTDQANFINFCSGKTITNGLQDQGGSCNGIVMGDIPSTGNMISSIIVNPGPGDNIAANQDFDIQVQVSNLVAGSFTNAQNTYYAAPQQLKGGRVVGHTHVTVQTLGNSLAPNQPPDPSTFAFFKGINDAGNGNGLLSATVTGGLPAGNYRVCTMTSASNHQPVLMPVAQRGAQDDCTKFTVGGNGGNNNNNGGNANGNNGGANANNGNANAGNANNGNANANAGNANGNGNANANNGNGNTGNANANNGNANTGNANANNGNANANNGNANNGNANNGNANTGNANTGNGNTGNANTGNANTGDANTGNANAGNANAGNADAGNTNTGDANTGNANADKNNQGDRNNRNNGTERPSPSSVASSKATATAISGSDRGNRMDRHRHRFSAREFVA